MSDKLKPSNSSDESEHQDFPMDADQGLGKGKRKSGRIRKNARISSNKDQDQKEQAAPQIEEQDSTDDDLLADIRRSLVEEEISKREKLQRGFFQRVTGRLKSGKVSPIMEPKAEESEPDEVDTVPVVEDVQKIIEDTAAPSSSDENALFAETVETSRPEAESERVVSMPAELDVVKFILGLEPVELIPEKPQDELLPQPELEENKIIEKTRVHEVLRVQPEKEKIDENFITIREVALEDYSDSPLQPEDMPAVSWRKKFRILLRGLKPLEKVLIFGAVSLIFIAGMIGFRIINAQVSEGTPVPTQDLPVPVRVTFPGGWEFKLTKGKVENGKWSPAGAEWLEGTELCKWVALPWSLQLEAVIHSLNSDDLIELTMSNADQLKYKVYSIENVPVDQIDTLDRNTTCLLLILVNEDVDTRWVVTALP